MTYEESILKTGDIWLTLNDEEKVEVLQTIENHMAQECNRKACTVEARFLYTGTDGIVLGEYDPKINKIYVNASQFYPGSMYGKNADRIVTACLHEGRHSLQHQVVKGEVFHEDAAEAVIWSENLKEGRYITYQENPLRYAAQPVEQDARIFGESRYEVLRQEREQLQQMKLEQDGRNLFAAQMEAPAEGKDFFVQIKYEEGWRH